MTGLTQLRLRCDVRLADVPGRGAAAAEGWALPNVVLDPRLRNRSRRPRRARVTHWLAARGKEHDGAPVAVGSPDADGPVHAPDRRRPPANDPMKGHARWSM